MIDMRYVLIFGFLLAGIICFCIGLLLRERRQNYEYQQGYMDGLEAKKVIHVPITYG